MMPPPPPPLLPRPPSRALHATDAATSRAAGQSSAQSSAQSIAPSARSTPSHALTPRRRRDDNDDDGESPFASRPVLTTPSQPTSRRHSLAPPSSAASVSSTGTSAATPVSQGHGRQDPSTVARIHELGGQGVSVVDIDRALHRERYLTSTATRWPSKNDGRVVVRLLLNGGIRPVAGDAKIARYVTEYAAKLEAKTPSSRGK